MAKKRKLSPAVAALLLAGVIIALAFLSSKSLTGASVVHPQQATATCISACETGYQTCLQQSSCSVQACKEVLKTCQNTCFNPNAPAGFGGGWGFQ